MENEFFNYGVKSFWECDENGKRLRFANEFFSQFDNRNNHDAGKLRSDIDDGICKKKYYCALCNCEIGFRGGLGSGKGLRRLYAFHRPNGDSNGCLYRDKSMPSEERVKAEKFAGLQTGEKHEGIKDFIKEKLKDNYFAEVDEEKRVYKSTKEYRQADLLITLPDNKKIAIEVQISTLWLTTVNQRNNHYRSIEIYILWIVDKFSPDLDKQSFTQERILVTNEYNVFAFDEAAKAATATSSDGELYLHCYYSLFDKDGQELPNMKDEIIPFSALTFRESDHMVYYKSKEDIQQEAINNFLEEQRVLKEEQERRKREEEKKEQEESEQRKKNEELRIEVAKEHLNNIARCSYNNRENRRWEFIDFLQWADYVGSTTTRKAVTEYICSILQSDIDHFEEGEPSCISKALINIFIQCSTREWIDHKKFVEFWSTKKRNYCNIIKIALGNSLYRNDDSRRMKLERLCFAYSLVKLYSEENHSNIKLLINNWQFIRTLFSLLIGQIIGTCHINYSALTTYAITEFNYEYLYINTYNYCIPKGNCKFKQDYSMKNLIEGINKDFIHPSSDLDIIVKLIFPQTFNTPK